jgi:hypothetical protein
MNSNYVWLADCYFAHNAVGLPVLLGFCDAGSRRPFHPFHHYPGSLARTKFVPQLWRTLLFPGCDHWIQQERAQEVN